MGKCKSCKKESLLISSSLSLCVDCIRNDFSNVLSDTEEVHAKARKIFNLPLKVPRDPIGIKCSFCVNACRVRNGKRGFCGLPIDARKDAAVSWYYDPLPTNCVAGWVCGGSHDTGYNNLAVFYNACSFNCLFCQNWHFRKANLTKKISAEDLAKKVNTRTSCICYFGGDPTPQLVHSLLASRIAKNDNKDSPLRICWETNGSMTKGYLKEMRFVFIVEVTKD